MANLRGSPRFNPLLATNQLLEKDLNSNSVLIEPEVRGPPKVHPLVNNVRKSRHLIVFRWGDPSFRSFDQFSVGRRRNPAVQNVTPPPRSEEILFRACAPSRTLFFPGHIPHWLNLDHVIVFSTRIESRNGNSRIT